MPTGAQGFENLHRNHILAVKGISTEMGTATASAGAATCNARMGKITSESLTTAAAAEYTLTLTNSEIVAGDFVLASVDALSSAGTPAIGGCTVTAGQVVITVSNVHASAAFDGPIQVNFMVVKAL